MKIAFFGESGKTMPAALTQAGRASKRYAKVSVTLLLNPDGSYDLVDASRDVIDAEQAERLKAMFDKKAAKQ